MNRLDPVNTTISGIALLVSIASYVNARKGRHAPYRIHHLTLMASRKDVSLRCTKFVVSNEEANGVYSVEITYFVDMLEAVTFPLPIRKHHELVGDMPHGEDKVSVTDNPYNWKYPVRLRWRTKEECRQKCLYMPEGDFGKFARIANWMYVLYYVKYFLFLLARRPILVPLWRSTQRRKQSASEEVSGDE